MLRHRHADPRLRGLDREAARAPFGIPPGDRLLLVFGGSQAVRTFNTAVADVAAAARRARPCLHLAGDDGYAAALAGREALPAALRERYQPIPFLSDDMADALGAADLVLGRAGSSTWPR